jgi:hypothetical protein
MANHQSPSHYLGVSALKLFTLKDEILIKNNRFCPDDDTTDYIHLVIKKKQFNKNLFFFQINILLKTKFYPYTKRKLEREMKEKERD